MTLAEVMPDEPQPTFNFRKVKRSWVRQFQRVDVKLMRVVNRMQSLYDSDATDAEIDEVMAQADAVEAEQDAMLCEVLVDVPRSWLVDGAPKKIDWGNPDSMEWLMVNRRTSLVVAMTKALNNPAGN